MGTTACGQDGSIGGAGGNLSDQSRERRRREHTRVAEAGCDLGTVPDGAVADEHRRAARCGGPRVHQRGRL